MHWRLRDVSAFSLLVQLVVGVDEVGVEERLGFT